MFSYGEDFTETARQRKTPHPKTLINRIPRRQMQRLISRDDLFKKRQYHEQNDHYR